MESQRFLLTGASGCIGAWVARELVREDAAVTIFDLDTNPRRLRLIMTDEQLARVNYLSGDISDDAAVERAVKETGATHLIHLAALQVPFCKVTPVLGARVNVVGTVNVFEAAKRAGLKHVVYASSIAVYGQSEDYPGAVVGDSAAQHPLNLYGVYKQANEGTARIYWQDDGISSTALRPYIVYGAGRDQGLTSGPTKAMLAAASGRSYQIAFGGRSAYQYVRDVARIFIEAARKPLAGAEVFNVRGAVVSMAEMVAAIEAAAPGAAGKITYAGAPLPFPAEVDDARLRGALGAIPETALQEGVRETVEIFKAGLQAGKLDPDRLL
jgi:nucleoside-diphosphate-sugar epimerase